MALSFGTLTFVIDGEKASIDLGAVTSPEWREIHRHTDRSPMEFLTSIDDVDCIEGLFWLARKRIGKPVEIDAISDLEGFAPLAFLASVDIGKTAKRDDAAPLDVTRKGTPSTRRATKVGRSSERGNATKDA